MLYRRGDPVLFCLHGTFQQGFVRDDEQPGSGLIDVVAEDGVWYGLSRNALTPLPRPAPAHAGVGANHGPTMSGS